MTAAEATIKAVIYFMSLSGWLEAREMRKVNEDGKLDSNERDNI